MSWMGFLQEQTGSASDGLPQNYSSGFTSFANSLGVSPSQYLEAHLHQPLNYPLPGGALYSAAAVATSTGVNPTETSYSLYNHPIPISVFGLGRIGGEIIAGPWMENGLASFCISFGVPADPSGTRDLREIAFDSEVVWTAAGGFTTEAFTYRFYGGTLTQSADALETTHFGAEANAYRPQILIWFENLPLAGTKFGKIPYVAAVIGDATGDDVNLGEAFERLAASPWVNLPAFEASGITDGVTSGGLILAQQYEFLQLIQQFGRFFPKWDILQTDKLRIVDRGNDVSPDIVLDKTNLMGKVVVSRAEPNSVASVLELSTIDPDADYTIVPSRAQRPRAPVAVTTSVKTDEAYLPIIMDSSTRASIVTYTKYHEEVARKRISFTAMAYGLEIEPGDLVAITGLGADFRDEVFRVAETLHGANHTVEVTAEAILRCDLEIGDLDLHLSQVVLLLGFGGSDGSTTFTDESPAARGDAVVVADAQVDTAFSAFGGSSGLFNGVGGGLFTANDGLLFSDSDDWSFGSGHFTVEALIRPTSVTGTRFIVGVWGFSAPDLSWVLYQNNTNLSWLDTVNGTSGGISVAAGTLAINTWQAVCADYDGTTLRIYIDGVMVGSQAAARTVFAVNQPLAIGVNSALTSFCFNGNMDELRITKGYARYASDSGYTVSTAAFPRV